MPQLAISIGILLAITGLVGFFAAGGVSLTALIPTGFGLILIGLGLLAVWQPGTRKHAMHIATAVALVGFIGSAQGIPAFFALLGNGDVERPWAATTQTMMAFLTAVFVAAAARSFIVARRPKAALGRNVEPERHHLDRGPE